jgi:hypothetical protein
MVFGRSTRNAISDRAIPDQGIRYDGSNIENYSTGEKPPIQPKGLSRCDKELFGKQGISKKQFRLERASKKPNYTIAVHPNVGPGRSCGLLNSVIDANQYGSITVCCYVCDKSHHLKLIDDGIASAEMVTTAKKWGRVYTPKKQKPCKDCRPAYEILDDVLANGIN